MTKGNRSTYFLQADEIDHLTIRYTDFGEHLNCKKAIEMIKFYSSAYDGVRDSLGGLDTSYDHLRSMSEEEIYDILVIIRTELLKTAFN